jgi:pimeloyl-ACP methyl ester carboxylesterase
MGYEDVTIPAREDGLSIAAYIPVAGQAPTRRLPSSGARLECQPHIGFNKHFLDLAQALHQAGFAVLMIDLRGRKRSAHLLWHIERRTSWQASIICSPKVTSLGRSACGTSSGAAAVLGAAAEEPAVGALVTDSLFAESYPIMKVLWRLRSAPMAFFYPTVGMFRLMYGYDLASAHPIAELAQIPPRPLLMIHCQADDHIPVEQFYQLKQAAPWAETWLVQDCRHSEIYEFVPQEYDQKVVGFFEKV